jgi:predicted PolB exonuclease-like 3'-5' exonuclease
MNVLVFDIETVPDVESGRSLYGNRSEMDSLSDEDVARVMFQQRHQHTDGQSEMLRHHLHKVVAISAVLRSSERLKVDSFGSPESSEVDIIRQFFRTVQHYTPVLVSWNGGGFDLPVLHYRALLHGISAQRYWDIHGPFRFDNYLNRYHERHTDLMDILAGYQGRAFAPLDEIATLLGFPGKLGMSGDKVWDVYLQEGGIQKIRDYCETDVLNTYLIFLRFELMRGRLTEAEYEQECQRLRDQLAREPNKLHFCDFLAAWIVN